MRTRDAQAGFVAALSAPEQPAPETLSPAPRFAIYRNNVAHTMIEALRASFPAVDRLVGEEFFTGLARAYFAADPPRSPLLFRYGGGLAGFIEGFRPADPVPYLADVARLDWAWLQAYHAADARPIGIEALAAVPAEALAGTGLALHPSLALIASRWPVVSIWAESRGHVADAGVDLSRGERAAVLRPGLEVDVRALPAPAHAFLAALAEGTALGPAAEAAAAVGQDGHGGFDLADQLSGLFAIGAVIAIKPASDHDMHRGDAG